MTGTGASLAERARSGSLSESSRASRLRHRTEQWRFFIEHHLNGDLGQQRAEFFFFTECPEECAIFQFLTDLDGDPSGDPYAAASKHLQCQVSRLGAVHRRPEVKRLDANRTLPLEAQARDLGSSIVIGTIEAGVPHRCIQKFVHRAKPTAGQDELQAYELVALFHVTQQLDFTLGAWREVGVASLRACHDVAISIPK